MRRAFAAAWPHTLPVCIGFLVLGLSYGLFATSQGLHPLYPFVMSLVIYAGSMEFITVDLLLAPFAPVSSFLLAMMIGARHLFYGISMLEPFRGTGWKKPFLIFGMCDETFSVNSTIVPKDVDRGYFMFFVTLLNQIYWAAGTLVGALLGQILPFSTKGIDFVMTALFSVLLLNKWEESRDQFPGLVGLVASILCLVLFGPKNFILPTMGLIVAVLLLDGKKKGALS